MRFLSKLFQKENLTDKQQAERLFQKYAIRAEKVNSTNRNKYLFFELGSGNGTKYTLPQGVCIKEFSKDEIIDIILNHQFNLDKTVSELKERIEQAREELSVQQEVSKIEQRKNRLKIKSEAEKRISGRTTEKERIGLSEEERDAIFERFNNACAVCNTKEGLHIHHKDHNPGNNSVNNLIVLCGVCHKKIHMTVR